MTEGKYQKSIKIQFKQFEIYLLLGSLEIQLTKLFKPLKFLTLFAVKSSIK